MSKKDWKFATKALHAGIKLDNGQGAKSTPIYQSSTFVFDSCEQGGRRFALEEGGYIYTRLGNPTTSVVETRLAELEGTEAAIAFSSGIGAITSVIWTILKAGDHIVADTTLYGCTFAYFLHGLTRYGVDVTFVDFNDEKAFKNALRPETMMVYFETPANPNLKIVDMKKVADIAHNYKKEIYVVIDNTFSTPYLQRPVEFGCDVIVHSATKYLNGHGDVVGGFACGTQEFMTNVRIFGLKDMTGAVQSPFDSYLVLRGLKTLPLRMDKHCENARLFTDYLKTKSIVDKIYFPGLPSHPGHDIAKKQMKDFGGMIAFELKGDMQRCIDLLNNLKLCTLAVSLGDTATLIQHPASMTHSPLVYSKEERETAGISDTLIRISLGIEDVGDLIEDFEQGFSKVR